MMTLAHSIRIAIVIDDDTGQIAEVLAALTVILSILIQFGQFVAIVAGSFVTTVERFVVTFKIASICFSAVSWGFLGVRL